MAHERVVATTLHSLTDPVVERAVRTWIKVVAPHVEFDDCVKVAVQALSRGHALAAFPCKKCGSSHLEGDVSREKGPRVGKECRACGHKWSHSPAEVGNPLAALGCQLVGAALYVAKVPHRSGELVDTNEATMKPSEACG